MSRGLWFVVAMAMAGVLARGAEQRPANPPEQRLRVRVSWGHRSSRPADFTVRLIPRNSAKIEASAGWALEAGEGANGGTWTTRAGGSDVDGVECTLVYRPATQRRREHVIWSALFRDSSPDAVARLREDPAFDVDPPMLSIQLDGAGQRGCTVAVSQLLAHRAMWVPALDLFISAGDTPVTFAEHLRQIEPRSNSRILDQVRQGPEASDAEYKAIWPDMGDPRFDHPSHIVGLAWDSSMTKFGVDRWASVSGDFGAAIPFRFAFDIRSAGQPGGAIWRGQQLADGLPIIVTRLDRSNLACEIEQFAYPLDGPPAERRGDMPVVLLQKLRMKAAGPAQRLAYRMEHILERPDANPKVEARRAGDNSFVVEDSANGRAFFTVEGPADVRLNSVYAPAAKDRPARLRIEVSVEQEVPADGAAECIVKLASPPLGMALGEKLLALRYDAAREGTVRFWEGHLARGAQFRVPERAVNELVRANLWHAMRLPRRHGGASPRPKIDLPYSNFAYDQKGTPWPVNQAVYVDYMLYDLRGYHDWSAEELEVMYGNQGADGRVGGYANWGVYTPGMLYAVGQHFLLSGDRASFDRLLPPTLRAVEWCLRSARPGGEKSTAQLVRAPLNDLTGEGVWAFNQAYLYAGLDMIGRALARIDHPRAAECRDTAAALREAILRRFGEASAQSPLVQLRDGMWSVYVPCEAQTPRRLIEQWYPTDVDTGAVHLLRLGALPAEGLLADALLNDHEDNLFLKNAGMANEPVYNQQATAYLLRDDPKAFIRAFYSYVNCAFSQSVHEPVEHRWGWGQYFGPPSTDGAGFELLRNMLLRETDADELLIGQAIPRAWMEEGKRIDVERAPTYLGPVSFHAISHAGRGELEAVVEMPSRRRPEALVVRLRHPAQKPVRWVSVNGARLAEFDADREQVRIARPSAARYEIVFGY